MSLGRGMMFNSSYLLAAAVTVAGIGIFFGGIKMKASANPNTGGVQTLKVLLGGDGKAVYSEECGVQSLETVLAAVLGQLVYSSESFDLKPGLLSHFHWDFDKKWYVLELREGLKFHNGRVVTSEDLEFSLLRGLLSKRGSWFKSFFANVQGIAALEGKTHFQSGMVPGIQILDQRSLAIKLNAPNPSFLHSLARSYFSLVPKEALQEDLLTWKTIPIGTGPYKITFASKDGSTLDLEKVNVEIAGPKKINVTSKGAAKEFDIVIGVPTGGSPLSDEVSSVANSVTGIYFNFENDLGRDLSFRRAIALGVSRKPLTTNVASYAPNSEFLASQFWGRAKLEERQDIQKARQALQKFVGKLPKEAIRIPVFNSEFGNGALGRYVEVLEGQLKEVGLNIIFYKSDKKFFDQSDREIPFRIISLGADVADPLVLFGLFKRGSPMIPHYPQNDTRYEELYNHAAHAESLDTKVLAVADLSRYFMEQVYAVPLFERHEIVGVNKTRIKSLGSQAGSLAVQLDRVVLK
jgi:ABC-type oligopeptide transport system substrate-binding subunit